MAKVLEMAPNDGLALYYSVSTYARLGKKEEAFDLLQKAIIKRYNNIIEWLEIDPDFENFRDGLRFKEIISKAKE